MRIEFALRRSLIYLLPLALLFVALSMRVAASDLMERLSLICFDFYQKAALRVAGDAPIRVVDIDDPSLSKIGQWPWPRAVVAQLVDRLREAGAAVVAFDIDFAEPDRTSPNCYCRCSPKMELVGKTPRGFSGLCPIPINGWRRRCMPFRS